MLFGKITACSAIRMRETECTSLTLVLVMQPSSRRRRDFILAKGRHAAKIDSTGSLSADAPPVRLLRLPTAGPLLCPCRETFDGWSHEKLVVGQGSSRTSVNKRDKQADVGPTANGNIWTIQTATGHVRESG
jgi:hypothetical protein